MPDSNEDAKPGQGPDRGSGRVRPRQNLISGGRPGFRKRYEAFGYWALLSVILALLIWFIGSSVANRRSAVDAEATVVATLFVAETETAEAEQPTPTGQ